MKAVAFTGHRPEKLSFCENSEEVKYIKLRAVVYSVIKRLYERGYCHFISGMAKGFDVLAAEEVCRLKREYENVKLTCAIPYAEQKGKTDKSYMRRWDIVTQNADNVIILSPNYYNGCFHERNRYMVDNAEVIVCLYNGKKGGGTAYTVNFALAKNKIVIRIDPDTLAVSIISPKKFND